MDRRQTLAVLTLALLAGCTSGPRALRLGQDACDYCRMTIDDARFGAMVLTARGRIQTFDSIECLASYVAALPAGEPPRGVYVANHDHPAQWVDATHATFLKSGQLKSPMGRELAAFPKASDGAALTARYGGHTLSWREVIQLVEAPRQRGVSNSLHGTGGVRGVRAL